MLHFLRGFSQLFYNVLLHRHLQTDSNLSVSGRSLGRMPVQLCDNLDRWLFPSWLSQSPYLLGPGLNFSIQVKIRVFLSNQDFVIFAQSCTLIYIEHPVISLSATATRLGLRSALEDFEVPTPPLSPW